MESSPLSSVPSSPPQLPQYPQSHLFCHDTNLSHPSSELSSLPDTPSPISSEEEYSEEDNSGEDGQENKQESNFVNDFDDKSDDNLSENSDAKFDNNSNNDKNIQTPDQVSSRIAEETNKFWRRRRLRGKRYGLKSFMESWLLGKTTSNNRSGSRAREMARVLRSPHIRERLSEIGVRMYFEEEEKDIPYINDLRKELSRLASKPAFKNSDHALSSIEPGNGPGAVSEIRHGDWVNSAVENSWSQIQEASPKLAGFLTMILGHQRSSQKSYLAKLDNSHFHNSARAYMMTALILGAYRSKTCNFLPLTIGMYLHSNGVQSRVINTLAQFGICPGYKAIKKRREEMSISSSQGRVPSTCTYTSVSPGGPAGTLSPAPTAAPAATPTAMPAAQQLNPTSSDRAEPAPQIQTGDTPTVPMATANVADMANVASVPV
ncbi:hypothetical protein K445DRAFT_319429 [Daldinia sp. EC12]|nr:hypothetical protein K445DRAFT_319429 [Daldinia sp. EC12]